jgi:hypothetical protein
MTRRDWTGLLAAFGVLGAMLAYRAVFVEPRDWGSLCAEVVVPLACHPRGALLWLQHWGLWGGGALGLGLWAFLGGPFAVRVTAVALGAVAVANYNASWGMLGLALGAWAWIGAARRAAPGT